MKKLGQNLRILLNKTRLSENELSRRTGIPQQVINRILSGTNQNPKIATLIPLANYFMITLSQLIGDEVIHEEVKLNTNHLGLNEIPLIDWDKLILLVTNKIILNKEVKKVFVDLEINENCFAVTLNSDSMQPRFPRGTVLVFDKARKVKNAYFGLFYIHAENRVVFRQYVNKAGKKYIKCLNSNSNCFNLLLLKKEDQLLAALIQSKFNY